jgi:hypothetical protein
MVIPCMQVTLFICNNHHMILLQVTDRESVSATEYAAWEARMNDLEKTLEEERARRHRYEQRTLVCQVQAQQSVLLSNGKLLQRCVAAWSMPRSCLLPVAAWLACDQV